MMDQPIHEAAHQSGRIPAAAGPIDEPRSRMVFLHAMRAFVDHPVTRLVVAIILIISGFIEAYDTFAEDVSHLRVRIGHGIILLGFINAFSSLPPVVDGIERWLRLADAKADRRRAEAESEPFARNRRISGRDPWPRGWTPVRPFNRPSVDPTRRRLNQRPVRQATASRAASWEAQPVPRSARQCGAHGRHRAESNQQAPVPDGSHWSRLHSIRSRRGKTKIWESSSPEPSSWPQSGQIIRAKFNRPPLRVS